MIECTADLEFLKNPSGRYTRYFALYLASLVSVYVHGWDSVRGSKRVNPCLPDTDQSRDNVSYSKALYVVGDYCFCAAGLGLFIWFLHYYYVQGVSLHIAIYQIVLMIPMSRPEQFPWSSRRGFLARAPAGMSHNMYCPQPPERRSYHSCQHESAGCKK